MKRQYTGLSRDVRAVLKASGGSIRYRPNAYEMKRDVRKERIGLWTVSFPPDIPISECLLWTPQRTVYLLYSLPDGSLLVEPKEPSTPYRHLHLLTSEDQEKYGLSLLLDTQGYPEITEHDGVKEVVVPGQRREKGRAIFLDGFGTGRAGFDLIYVLFTYHRSGKREIYLLPPDEKADASKRYTHLYEQMPARAEPGTVRTVMVALDHHLKETYGIDWEQELEERAYGQ
jgi:hypothetical protein